MFIRPRPRNERGATLILVALCLVASMSVIGIVVDGGQAFSERRQMQNAADAAAVSAARTLDVVLLTTVGDPSLVRAAAVAIANTNGATSSSVVCDLVDETGTNVMSCPLTTTPLALATQALVAGVRVSLTGTVATTFIRVAGIKTVTAGAKAMAQIEGLKAANSPFVMCATGGADPRSVNDGQSTAVLLPNNTLNQAAVGTVYSLHFTGTGSGARCGQDAVKFKGISLDQSSSFPTPGPWQVDTGNHGVNVQPTVIAGTDACKVAVGWTVGCLVIVPLCHAAPYPPAPAIQTGWGIQGSLYCERLGSFRIATVGSSTITATFVNGIAATGGRGGGKAQSGELRVIKLSE